MTPAYRPRRDPTPLCWLCAAMILFVAPSRLPAQRAIMDLQPGARVRVTIPALGGDRLDALLSAKTGDSLVLIRAGYSPMTVAVSTITAADVYRGRSRGAGARRGVKWGAIIGAALGALAIVGNTNYFDEVCEPPPGTCDRVSDVEAFAAFTLTGVGYGAAIGAIARVNRWERLSLPDKRVSLLTDPARRQLGVRFAL